MCCPWKFSSEAKMRFWIKRLGIKTSDVFLWSLIHWTDVCVCVCETNMALISGTRLYPLVLFNNPWSLRPARHSAAAHVGSFSSSNSQRVVDISWIQNRRLELLREVCFIVENLQRKMVMRQKPLHHQTVKVSAGTEPDAESWVNSLQCLVNLSISRSARILISCYFDKRSKVSTNSPESLMTSDLI